MVVTRGMSQPLLAGLKSVVTKLKVRATPCCQMFSWDRWRLRRKINFNNYLEQLKDEGGQLISEDFFTEKKGAFVSPSLFEVTGDESVLKHEFFGPNICVEIAEDEDDGFRRAAANEFGLSGSLFPVSGHARTFLR